MTAISRDDLLLFLPETGIEPYLRTLAILADGARQPGQRIWVTQCDGNFSYCSMMGMYNVPIADIAASKKKLCAICKAKLDEVCREYDFLPLPISSLALELPQSVVSLINEQHTDLGGLVYEGFPLGQMAAYDFSLATKHVYSVGLAPEYQKLMRACLENTLRCLAFGKAVMEKYSPNCVLTFNEYASCCAIRYHVVKAGGRFVTCTLAGHRGLAGNRIVCTSETLSNYSLTRLRNWIDQRDIPVRPQDVEECCNDVLFRSYGSNSHLFSANKQASLQAVSDGLGLDPRKKLCVVYTSSEDERYGLDTILNIWGDHPGVNEAFASQIEWLQALREFAAKRDDVQIIVRVHPREGTKKRGGVSGHLMQLQTAFAEQMQNIIFVWPDDPVSSYDLMEFADVVLVAWSTMGAESFRVGVPVLAWAGNMYYVDSKCMRVATTKESYFAVLDEMLHQAPSFEQLREGIRYCHWRTFISSIDLSKTVDPNPYLSSYWPKAPDSRRSIIRDIMQGKVADPLVYNASQWKAALNESSQDSEQRAIVVGLRALIEVTFCPPQHKPVPLWFRVVRKAVRILTKKNLVWQNSTVPQVQDFTHLQLECLSGQQKDSDLRQRTRKNKNLRVLVSNGNENAYYRHGKCLHRTSKLISRFGSYIAAFNSAASNDL